MDINEQNQINKKTTVNHNFIRKNNQNTIEKNGVNLGGIKKEF